MASSPDPILQHELPIIAQIIRNEIKREAARRGRPVPPDDPVVRDKVSKVVLRIGADLRKVLSRQYCLAADTPDAA